MLERIGRDASDKIVDLDRVVGGINLQIGDRKAAEINQAAGTGGNSLERIDFSSRQFFSTDIRDIEDAAILDIDRLLSSSRAGRDGSKLTVGTNGVAEGNELRAQFARDIEGSCVLRRRELIGNNKLAVSTYGYTVSSCTSGIESCNRVGAVIHSQSGRGVLPESEVLGRVVARINDDMTIDVVLTRDEAKLNIAVLIFFALQRNDAAVESQRSACNQHLIVCAFVLTGNVRIKVEQIERAAFFNSRVLCLIGFGIQNRVDDAALGNSQRAALDQTVDSFTVNRRLIVQSTSDFDVSRNRSLVGKRTRNSERAERSCSSFAFTGGHTANRAVVDRVSPRNRKNRAFSDICRTFLGNREFTYSGSAFFSQNK